MVAGTTGRSPGKATEMSWCLRVNGSGPSGPGPDGLRGGRAGVLDAHGGRTTRAGPLPQVRRGHARRALAQALDLAAREGHVVRNVARLVKRPRQRRIDPHRWTAAEAARFRAHALTDRLAAAWLLSLADLRRSEVLGLKWGTST